MSYTGTLHGQFTITVNGGNSHMFTKNLGEIPVMVKVSAIFTFKSLLFI